MVAHVKRKLKRFYHLPKLPKVYKSCKFGCKCKSISMGNVNAKCKGYLAFQASKCIALGNAFAKYCKFFYNSATV